MTLPKWTTALQRHKMPTDIVPQHAEVTRMGNPPVKPAQSRSMMARILDVAKHEFGRHGLERFGMGDIAARIGISKQNVYYHFGNKILLYKAAMDEISREYLACFSAVDFDAMPPLEALRTFFELMFDWANESQDGFTHDLMTRGGDLMEPRSLTCKIGAQILALFESLVERGKAEGVVAADIEAHHLFTHADLLSRGYSVSKDMIERYYQRDFTSDEAVQQWREYSLDALMLMATRPTQVSRKGL